MLGSVIYARDRWLKPGGLMLPSFATVCVFNPNAGSNPSFPSDVPSCNFSSVAVFRWLIASCFWLNDRDLLLRSDS